MPQKQFKRAANIAFRTMAGEDYLIVLNAGESKMFNLNQTGVWFWNQLESPRTKEQLLTAMLAEYEVDQADAVAEIDRFVDYLMQHQLICPC
jgi:hypothetical protein